MDSFTLRADVFSAPFRMVPDNDFWYASRFSGVLSTALVRLVQLVRAHRSSNPPRWSVLTASAGIEVLTDDLAVVDSGRRFAMVPEWLLEADVSDTAVRLYGLLLRSAVVDGLHVQSRARLAERMRRSIDTVDRAMTALVTLGALHAAPRFRDGRQIPNGYWLRTDPPPVIVRAAEETQDRGEQPSAEAPLEDGPVVDLPAGRRRRQPFRLHAVPRSESTPLDRAAGPATPTTDGEVELEGGRRSAAAGGRRGAARKRVSNQNPPPPPLLHLAPPRRTASLDEGVTASHRWGDAPGARGAPPASRHPEVRSREADDPDSREVAGLEARLAALDGYRPVIQHRARVELRAERRTLTRTTVVRRACLILDRDEAR